MKQLAPFRFFFQENGRLRQGVLGGLIVGGILLVGLFLLFLQPWSARSTPQALAEDIQTLTVWDQYSKQVQQQLLANKRHWAAQDQIRIVHCNIDKVNEQLADGFLLFKTVNGNGKNIGDNEEEELYDITLGVEKNAWKITAILHCITDGCLNVTNFIIL